MIFGTFFDVLFLGSSLFLMDQSKIEKLNLPETKYSMVIRLSVDLNPLAFLLTAE
ncbi:MAG: hypothetical protein ACI9FZ_001377, partial [Bacteroidia bacterium]